MSFYDIQVDSIPDIKFILSKPILFKLWVMDYAVASGRWPVIGNQPLEQELLEAPYFFKQDIISKKFSRYRLGKEIPASRDECHGLERAAVWDPEHVEDRLRDYFAGVPNRWVESLKLPEK